MTDIVIPSKQINCDYPVIDTDPHFKRVIRYARPIDYAHAVGTFVGVSGLFHLMNYLSPPKVPLKSIIAANRLVYFISASGGFFRLYQRSSFRFWGWTENQREIEMDMREMVDKVKRKEPLYGTSRLDPYMQGVAARTTRYSQVMLHAIPMFNFVNHNQHGVDTRKYFLAAEEELEAESRAKAQKA